MALPLHYPPENVCADTDCTCIAVLLTNLGCSHSPDELRENANIPDEWQLQILPDSSVSSSSTSAVLSCLPAKTRGAAQAAIVQLPQIIQMFESGTDRMMQPQQMLPLQLGTGQIAQGAAAWGSASMASSSSHFDSGSNLLVQADAVQQYGSPSMMRPQHTFNTLQQQTEVLQYGPACGLHSNSPGMGITAQPAACVLNTGQPGVLVAQQQQPLGGVSIPGGAAGAAQSPGYLAGRGLQPASGGWVSAGTPSQLPYGAGNSASMAASPPILGVQGTMLMPAQGGMYLQSPAGAHQVPHGFQQQQQPYLPPPQSGFMPQRAPNMGAVQLAQQQQPAGASAPLSNTMLLQQLQQLQQPQMLPGGMVIAAGPACGMLPSGGPACSPQQQLSGGAASSHLMQQLQALTLTSVTVSQQL